MRTLDGGISWETCSDGLESLQCSVDNIDVSPTDPNDVILCAYRLFRWDDEASGWRKFGLDVYDAVFAPTNPSRIYACSYYSVYYTEDGGENWQINTDKGEGYSIAVSSFDEDRVLIAEPYVGVWGSDDGCETIHFSSDGIACRYVDRLAICETNVPILVAGGDDFICRSPDGGNLWAPSIDVRGLHDYRLRYAASPSDPGVLYAADGYNYLFYRSNDAGLTWSYVADLPYDMLWIIEVTVDPSNENRVYLVGYRSIYRSDNGGASWEVLVVFSDGYSGGGYSYFLSVDPNDSARMYAGTSVGLYMSEDDGDSFDVIFDLGNAVPDFVEFDPLDPDTIYCGENYASGTNTRPLNVSHDLGQTWTPVNTTVNSVSAMAINPSDSNEFYIAGERAVYHTIDAGEVWLPLAMDGFDCPVTTSLLVDFDPSGNDVFATGYGVFSYLDTGTPFISLSLSSPGYAPGDTLRLSCDMTNPVAPHDVDLAVWVEMPNGAQIYIPSLWTDYSPYYSGLIPGRIAIKDHLLLEAGIDPGLPLGEYTVFAVMYERGTDEQISNVATAAFSVLAGIE
ncbi:MAG: hypothetical protein JW941_07595 [Candidatus Coatesbacteria bacterium]|nr:hypothetical protein [Candidatus Coatesbacteria bacterium]